MKISRIIVDNILSFGLKTEIHLEKRANLIIGPNGGGKSNLMDIIHGLLNAYVFWHFQEQKWDPSGTGYTVQHQDPSRVLKKHWDLHDKPQRVILDIELEEGDRNALKAFLDGFESMCEFENEQSQGHSNDIESHFNPLLDSRNDALVLEYIQLELTGSQINRSVANQWLSGQTKAVQLFFKFFNFLEKLKRLAEDMGRADDPGFAGLKYRSKYYPPSRFHQSGDGRIVLHDNNLQQLLLQTKKASSHTTSSDVAFASFYFSRLFARRAFNNQNLIEEGQPEGTRSFQQEEQVVEVNNYLQELGDYRFSVGPLKAEAGEYFFKIHLAGREVSLAELSSGQKEAINLVLSIVAFDLQDALVMIDEPEAHLHPQWQKKVLKMLRAVSERRNIQLLLPTHSSLFVDRHSIGEVVRVFKSHGCSKVVPSNRGPEWRNKLASDADLIQIIDLGRSVSIFFSDVVLLVEGPTDAILVRQILEDSGLAPEGLAVIPVGGKDSFGKYVRFLRRFGIPSAILCDLDSVWRGALLAHIPKVQRFRSLLDSELVKRGTEELGEAITGRRVSRIVRRDVAIALLDCHKRLSSGQSEGVEDRLLAITEFVGLRSDIADQVNLDHLAKEVHNENFSEFLGQIQDDFEVDAKDVPLLILPRGDLEDYTGERHSIDGALRAVATLQRLDWSSLEEGHPMRELGVLLQSLVNELLDSSKCTSHYNQGEGETSEALS